MPIRKAVEGDISNLLPLMRELAEFENYANDFAVTVLLPKKAANRLDSSFITLSPSLIERSRI
jgi:Zn-dependent peptidase ImmA (M78 family)